jgi:hypothetical protein
VKLIPFPIERTGGNKADRVAVLLEAIYTLDELEAKLEKAGALKGVYLIWNARRWLVAEYPEFFMEIKPDDGGAA